VDRQLPLRTLQDRLRRGDRGLRLGQRRLGGGDLAGLFLETGLHLGRALLELVERPAVEHARRAAGLVAGRGCGGPGERERHSHDGERDEGGTGSRRRGCAPPVAREHRAR
jgi:hypothetical protein